MSKSFIEIDTDTDWEKLCSKQTLSEDFIREFKDKVNWECISYHQTLSEDFIREFKDKVDWNLISTSQRLSEDFIREFKDKVNWHVSSAQQNLSEDFIREFQDKVNWGSISHCQIISDKFIEEFKDKITFSRPDIIFSKDLAPIFMSHNCNDKDQDFINQYLKTWDKDQEITWNELVSKCTNKLYIDFLAGDLENRLESSNNNQLPNLEEMYNKWTK